MITFQYFDLMERYARSGMTEEERFDFETLLRTNKELAAEWDDYLLIARSVRNSIKSKSVTGPQHIPQLVNDARDLAKENGLLLTDEDIWLYLRGKAPAPTKEAIEKRMKSDLQFNAQVERESALVEAIVKNSSKFRLIQNVRDSLSEQGFTASLHEQIRIDMEQEEHSPNSSIRSREKTNPPPASSLWLLAITFVLAIAAGVVWWISQPKSQQALLQAESRHLISVLPDITALKQQPSSTVASAFRLISNDMPDAALNLLTAIPEKQQTPEVIFLEGVAYFIKTDYSKAVSRLTLFPSSTNSELHLKSLWLLALSYRALQQEDNFTASLKQLLERYRNQYPTSYEVKRATELLSE